MNRKGIAGKYLLLAVVFLIFGAMFLYVKSGSASTNIPQVTEPIIIFTEPIIVNNFTELSQPISSDCEQTELWGWICVRDKYSILSNMTINDIINYPQTVTILGKRYTYWIVCSQSMYPVVTCENNYAMIEPFDKFDMRKGDIIAFYGRSDYQGQSLSFVVHRIVDIRYDREGKYYVTKGDHNTINDSGFVRPQEIYFKVIGRYVE